MIKCLQLYVPWWKNAWNLFESFAVLSCVVSLGFHATFHVAEHDRFIDIWARDTDNSFPADRPSVCNLEGFGGQTFLWEPD